MDKHQITQVFDQAYQASPAAMAAFQTYQDACENLARLRARSMEAHDKLCDLSEMIESEIEQIDNAAIQTSFEDLQKRREKLRGHKNTRKELRAFCERLDSEIQKAANELPGIQQQAIETIHAEVLQKTYEAVNAVFRAGVNEAEKMVLNWTDAWVAWRNKYAGTASPKLKAVSRIVAECIHEG